MFPALTAVKQTLALKNKQTNKQKQTNKKSTHHHQQRCLRVFQLSKLLWKSAVKSVEEGRKDLMVPWQAAAGERPL